MAARPVAWSTAIGLAADTAALAGVFYGGAISLVTGTGSALVAALDAGSMGMTIMAIPVAFIAWIVGLVGSFVVGFPLAATYRRYGIDGLLPTLVPGLVLAGLSLSVLPRTSGTLFVLIPLNLIFYAFAFWLAARRRSPPANSVRSRASLA